MNKLLLLGLLGIFSILGVQSKSIRKREALGDFPVNPKYLAALPLLGGYALYRKFKTGSFAPPMINLGVQGAVGVGPVDIGGKVGFGAGGTPEEGHDAFYEPPSEESVGVKGFHAGSKTVLGVDNTQINLGAGVAGGLEEGASWPKVPAFIKKIPSYFKSLFGYLPYYPSEVSESSTKRLVEYDPADTEGWVTVLEDQEEDSSWSNVFGVQGGVGLGPIQVNGGLNLGR